MRWPVGWAWWPARAAHAPVIFSIAGTPAMLDFDAIFFYSFNWLIRHQEWLERSTGRGPTDFLKNQLNRLPPFLAKLRNPTKLQPKYFKNFRIYPQLMGNKAPYLHPSIHPKMRAIWSSNSSKPLVKPFLFIAKIEPWNALGCLIYCLRCLYLP